MKKIGRPKKEKQVQIAILISQELAKQLKKISRNHGRSRSAHLGLVLKNYCDQESDNAK
jgi:predicted DNA-binding protein